MKIERLLAIITFLMNRDVVTGKVLAEKFEVTERTIQRDIESINMAGIPIVSLRGVQGGYKIMDHYRLGKQTTTKGDLESLMFALSSLNTAVDHEHVNQTLEKIRSLNRQQHSQEVSVDFGIAKEDDVVQRNKHLLEAAIKASKQVSFHYTNAKNHTSIKIVEPVQLKFKWYAWYLVGYLPIKDTYNVYKLPRMTDVQLMASNCVKTYDDKIDWFEEVIEDKRDMTKVILNCPKTSFVSFREHFHRLKVIESNEDFYTVSIYVIESERLWFALLLSFSDEVKVIEPKHIKERLFTHAKKIVNFEIPDK